MANLLHQVPPVPARQRRNAERFAKPKLAELRSGLLLFGGIRFIRDEKNGNVSRPEKLGNHHIKRSDSLTNIDDKQNKLGLADRMFDLGFDMFSQIGVILDTETAGIDKLKEFPVQFDQSADAVAGDPRGGINDTDPPPCQRVQQGAFAHIRASNNRNNR